MNLVSVLVVKIGYLHHDNVAKMDVAFCHIQIL
jgi:hypothetical protein